MRYHRALISVLCYEHGESCVLDLLVRHQRLIEIELKIFIKTFASLHRLGILLLLDDICFLPSGPTALHPPCVATLTWKRNNMANSFDQ